MIIVTGCAGYIGRHVMKRLMDLGIEHIGLDIRHDIPPPPVEPCLGLYGCDVRRMDNVRPIWNTKTLPPPTAVIHLAAYISVVEAEHQIGAYYYNNVHSMWNLVRCCQGSLERFVLASSAAVYNHGVYGDTKRACELINDDSMPEPVNARIFNVAGNQHTSNTHLIPRLIKTALDDDPQPLTLYGGGTMVRDYVHVEDVADVLVTLATCQRDVLSNGNANTGCTVDVGTGRGLCVNDVHRIVCNHYDVDIPVERVKEKRPGDPQTLIADPRDLGILSQRIGRQLVTNGIQEIIKSTKVK